MPGAWDNIGRVFRDGLRAIAPHGPGGVIAVLLAVIGVGGLVLHADPLWTFIVVAFCFGAYSFLDERDYRRRVTGRTEEFTNTKDTQVVVSRERLEKRLEVRRAGDEPLLFDEKGGDREHR
jgi:hypothetical protein